MRRYRPRLRGLRWVLLAKAAVGGVLAVGFIGAGWLKTHGVALDDMASELRQGGEPRFAWKSINGKHWQAVAPSPGELPELTDAREKNGAGCGPGMVRVHGNYRHDLHGDATGEIERVEDDACVDWINKDFPARCRTFERGKITDAVAPLPIKPLDYCIDRFEYPNVLGENPVIVVTFHEAEALCKKSSKRLCDEDEWTFACEGEEVSPYPNGWERDTTACVMDRNWKPFTEGALSQRDGEKARAELDRLWQAEPSGSRSACKSSFGVYDMTGNVDEWTRSVRKTGYASVLKGGYWGPVRARCRPATRAHNEDFIDYQQGFRCCADSSTSVPPPAAMSMPQVAAVPPPRTDADAGAPPVVHVDPRHEPSSPVALEQEGDENEGIAKTKARVKLGCDVASAPGAPGSGQGLAAFAIAVVSVLRARRWKTTTRPRPT